MFFIYQLIIFIGLFFLPLIFFVRFKKNKESIKSFSQKLSIPSKKRNNGNLVWFHGASVGELMSVIPLIQKLEKNIQIKNILVTTTTLSSYKVFKKFKFKKTIHQFFPIDFYFITKKFLKYWKPSIAIFIDSEIWPCMFRELNNNGIRLFLLNARITKKSYKKWIKFKKFGKKIFSYISKAYPQNIESHIFLKKLGVKNLKNLGNLKYTNLEKNSDLSEVLKYKKKFNNKLIFCAASTHEGEEEIIAKSHFELKKKFKNILTIIIPRHTTRINKIKLQINKLNLNYVVHSNNQIINNDTDLYLVDTYGETKKFFQISDIVFMGGSLINHGGQNPIEAARFGLKILHGPNVKNFNDIYKFFKQKKISYKVHTIRNIVDNVIKFIKNKKSNNKVINKYGEKILEEAFNQINNEIKKT